MINQQIFQFPIIYTNQFARIAIGWGAHQTVADECKAVNIKKALITTTGLKGTGIIEEINQILTTQGISTEIYNKITTNPKDHEVMEAYSIFKDAECDGVVSVGGGSSHDCGKAVRMVAAHNGQHIRELAGFPNEPRMKQIVKQPITIPQICVNTTAGTAAESNPGGVITNTEARVKHPFSAPGMVPARAIVDPLLIRLMPSHITAWTGWDAFAHAFECFTSRISVLYSQAMQLGVIRLIAEYLREFTYNRMNHIACEKMCYAESMAGVGIMMGGGAGIVHGFGHTISVLTNTHHGRMNAVLTLPTMRFNEASCPDKYGEMARAMGVDIRGMTSMQAADKWLDEVEKLLADLNIQSGNLNKQFGFQEKDLEHVVNTCLVDFAREGNPRELTFEEGMKLLKDMM